MEGKMRAVSSRMVLLAMMLSFSLASAFDFYVGGTDGWVPHPSESFNQWAQRNRFQVNDTLVFKFKKEDSVLEVKESDYRECNRSNPIQKLEKPRSVFRLDRPGAFFFISGKPGQCQEGQKLTVVVLAVHSKAPAASPVAVQGAFNGEVYSPVPAPAVSGASSVGGSFLGLVFFWRSFSLCLVFLGLLAFILVA